MRIFFGHGGGQQADADKAQSLPSPSKTSEELRFLDPASMALKLVGSRLHMQGPDDEEWRPISLVHLFPLSDEDGWVSVLDKDGHELGILRSLRGLSEESLRLAREELRRRYIAPRILRVLSCRERFDLLQWKVETDRGVVTFLTRGLRGQAQEPLPNHFSVTDVEGSRYEIPNLLALDPVSRALLEAHL